MSIVALKRKSNATTGATISHDRFSINGGVRGQGYIGRTSDFQSRMPVQTSTEDSRVIKASTLSYDGMVATKYRWIGRPAPFTTVKQVPGSRSQSEFIEHLHQTRIWSCPDPLVKIPVISYGTARQLPSKHVPNANVIVCTRVQSIPNMPGKTGALSADEYLEKKRACMAQNDHFSQGTPPVTGSCGGVYQH